MTPLSDWHNEALDDLAEQSEPPIDEREWASMAAAEAQHESEFGIWKQGDDARS